MVGPGIQHSTGEPVADPLVRANLYNMDSAAFAALEDRAGQPGTIYAGGDLLPLEWPAPGLVVVRRTLSPSEVGRTVTIVLVHRSRYGSLTAPIAALAAPETILLGLVGTNGVDWHASGGPLKDNPLASFILDGVVNPVKVSRLDVGARLASLLPRELGALPDRRPQMGSQWLIGPMLVTYSPLLAPDAIGSELAPSHPYCYFAEDLPPGDLAMYQSLRRSGLAVDKAHAAVALLTV